MQHAATTWTFASADNRLAGLMKAFGCADVIAPVDAEAFGKRAGELLTRVVFSKRAEWLARVVSGGAARSAGRAQDRSRAPWWTSACPNAVDRHTHS
jgi:hypothetical protein